MQKLINQFILNLLRLFCLISFLLFSSPTSFASETFSYSGRLVNSNGSPVPGRVNLTFDLAYSDQLGVILCTEELDGVELVNGVFHVKLVFESCNLPNILANDKTVNIRVTDRTPDPDRVYSFQAIHSVPKSIMSQMTKQLVQMGAVDGQVLTWRNGKWGAENQTGATNGTVTQITATDGLSGGTITNTGTIGILDNGVTSLKILDDTIVDADISATAEIAQSKIKNLATDLAAKESLIGSGASTDYLNGTKVWNNFDQSVRNALLIGYTAGTATPIAATDNVMEAIGKLEGQIIANDTAFDNAGQWNKDGSLLFYNSGNVGIGTSTPTDKLEVMGDISVSNKLRFKNSAISYVELRAPVGAGAVTLTLPGALGTNGQVLSTDSSGNLSWLTPSTDSSQITDGSIVDADISGSANIAQTKISGLGTSLSGKQDVIALSDTTTYYRGDKTWQTLTTDAVPQGSRLYFTEPLVLGTDLLGFVSAPGTISASDTVLTAIEKLDGNQANYVLKAGDTMTGPLVVVDPTADEHAANKLYVDTQTALTASKWSATGSNIYYNSGNVGVGTSNPGSKLHIVGPAAFENSTASNQGSTFSFWKTRNYAATINNDELGFISFYGHDGTSLQRSAFILSRVEGTVGAGSVPGNISFNTTSPSGNDSSEKMIITASGKVGIGTSSPQGKLDVKGTLLLSGATSGYVGLAPAAVAGSTIYTLPSSDGSAGDLLKTNGAGVLSWQAPQSTTPTGAAGGDLSGTYPNPSITGLAATKISDGSIDNTEFGYLNGVSSNLQTQLNAKEAAITAGTIDQYWAGTKSWRDFDADVRTALLSAYSVTAGVVASGDGIQTAISKLDGNIASLQANGQWSKNSTDIYYNSGNVGIGTTTPQSKLDVAGVIRANEICDETGSNCKDISNGWSAGGSGLAMFGTRVTKNIGTVYQALEDGYVIVDAIDGDGYYSILSDNTNPPVTPILNGKAFATYGSRAGSTVPVKKGDYWKVTTTYGSNPRAIFWQPLTGTLVANDGHSLDSADGSLVDSLYVSNSGNVGIATTTPSGLLDINTGNSSRIVKYINPQANSYNRSVILLHEVYTGTLLEENHVIGRIFGRRGSVSALHRHEVAEIRTGSAYNGTTGQLTSLSSDSLKWKLVTVTYNGIKYLAVDVPYLNANLSSGFVFDGLLRSTAADSLKLVDYLNVQSSTVLNAEVNSSIADFTPSGQEYKDVDTFSVSGKIGVGTTTPAAALDVAVKAADSPTTPAAIFVRAADQNFQMMAMSGSSSNANASLIGKLGMRYMGGLGVGDTAMMRFYRGGTNLDGKMALATNDLDRLTVDANGYVGIGTTAPAYKLDVRGGNVNSEGAITNVSDRRLKENILPLESTLQKILQLESVSYVWKDRSFDPSKQVGFIAQDVEKVFPEVVKTDSKGFKAMSYSQLISPVVKAIQELYAKWSDDHDEIEKLKNENAVLKAQNEEILKRLDRLEKERMPASDPQ